jgi:hypothetical protein
VATLPSPLIGLRPLAGPERESLVRWLGDSPFTALEVGQLRSGLCRAYAIGGGTNPVAAVVHSAAQPTEPAAFGSDGASIWSMLSRVPG